MHQNRLRLGLGPRLRLHRGRLQHSTPKPHKRAASRCGEGRGEDREVCLSTIPWPHRHHCVAYGSDVMSSVHSMNHATYGHRRRLRQGASGLEQPWEKYVVAKHP